MVSFSCRISPLTSTVIFFERSPLATAFVTSAMLRTWPVRLLAIELTLSVRSFHTPATPLTSAWPPSLPSVPTSRATRVTSEAKLLSWSTIVLMVFLSSRISPFTSTVIFLDRSPSATAAVTSAMLRTWPVRFAAMALTLSVRSFHVPPTPGTCAWPPSLPSVPTPRATRGTPQAAAVRRAHAPGRGRLAAELASGADLPRHARHFRGEGVQLIDHRVDGVLQLQDLALHVDGDLLGKVALRHRGRDFRDVADLAGQIARHQVHRVRKVGPGAGDALDLRLAAQLSFRADLAGDARHF